MNPFNSKIFYIVIWIVFAACFAYPQSAAIKFNDILPIVSNTKLIIDTSKIEVREIDSLKIKSYLKDKDFNYFENPEDTRTLWEKINDWIKRQIGMLIDLDVNGITWNILQYILIAFAVLSLIFGLYKNEIKSLFLGNKKINQLRFNESIEDIHSIDYDKLIDEALQNKNCRFAIRLNYLRTLKKLSDKNIIKWKPDKTNHDYLRELKTTAVFSQFSLITNDFENIWYGGFDVDHNNYSLLISKYSEVNSLLEKY